MLIRQVEVGHGGSADERLDVFVRPSLTSCKLHERRAIDLRSSLAVVAGDEEPHEAATGPVPLLRVRRLKCRDSVLQRTVKPIESGLSNLLQPIDCRAQRAPALVAWSAVVGCLGIDELARKADALLLVQTNALQLERFSLL